MKIMTRNVAVLFAAVMSLAGPGMAQNTPPIMDGFNDGNFVVTGRVCTAACDASGKLLLGGEFSVLYGPSYHDRLVTRIHGNNVHDDLPNLNGSRVSSIVSLPDGAILVGGDCNVSGVTNLIKIGANNAVDPTFAPDPKGYVHAMARQSDGKILVGGAFTSICGQPRSFLARLNTNGTFDTTFTAQPNSNVTALAVLPDGRILLGGAFTSIGGTTCARLARLSESGSIDGDFVGAADGLVRTLAVYPNGGLLVGGDFNTISGVAKRGLCLLYQNGQPRHDFAGWLDSGASAYSVAILPDGQALVGGTFSMLGGTHLRQRLARLNVDGTVDTSFSAGITSTGTVWCVAVQPNGMIVVGGDFTSFNGASVRHVVRLHENGLLDQTLEPTIVTDVGYGPMGLALQANGGIVCGGDMVSVDGSGCSYFARLDARGRFDAWFADAYPNNWVLTIAIDPAGVLRCGGMFTEFDHLPRRKLAELTSAGEVSTVFTNGVNGVSGYVYAMATLADGRVLVAGGFTNIAGAARSRLAIFHPDGTLDSGFNAAANGEIYSVAVRPDGNIVVAGNFTLLNGTARPRLGAFLPDGTLNTTFNPAPDNAVYSLLAQPDGRILVGGSFTNIGGGTSRRLARLQTNGVLDATFTLPEITGGPVHGLALYANGDVLAGGEFTNVTGSTFCRFALFTSDGEAKSYYATYTRASNAVMGMAIQPDGKVITAGDFLKVSSFDRIHMARFLPYPLAAARHLEADTNGTWLTWTLTGSAPQVWRTEFEYSINGTNWTTLGAGTYMNGTWRLSGLGLPLYQLFYVRAKGVYATGRWNGSQSVMQSVRQFYLTPQVVPVITITSSSGAVVLPEGTTSCTVSGTQTNVLGSMWWAMNGRARVFDAASPWSTTVTDLVPGTNHVDVFGTSISGMLGQDSVDLIVQPNAPTGVTATDRACRDCIRVSWTAAAGAVAYEVWRGMVDDSALAACLGETVAVSYDDASVTPNRRYYYWIKARHATGLSAFSSSASGRRGGASISYSGGTASDLALYDAAAGLWFIRNVAGETLAWSVAWGFVGGVPVEGDYDGDGVLDLAVFDSGSGNWYIMTMAGTVLAWAEPWGWAGAVPVPGDYDGDGVSDLAVFDGASGAWYIRTMAGATLAWAMPWGWLGAMPVAGDYNGDGASDLCVFDPARAVWYILALDGRLIGWELAWGGVGFDPVPGDYDGDGIWDMAMYQDSLGRWYIRTVPGTTLLWDVSWGGPGMSAVSGDFDGDRIWDLAVYQEAAGRWYVRTVSGTGILWDSSWGGPGLGPVSQ